MSQQECVPPGQTQQQSARDDADNVYAHSYGSATAPAVGVPKEEPAASYDEPMVQSDYQSGYSAQDYAAIEVAPSIEPPILAPDEQQPPGSREGCHYMSDGGGGDAFENSYHSQAAGHGQWSVPPWARPQQQPRGSTRLFWLIVGLMLAAPALYFLLGFLAVAAVIAFSVALPFLFFGLFAIPYYIFRAARRTHPRRWPYLQNWRRPGPGR